MSMHAARETTAVLTEAGLVSARKQGQFHYYRVHRDALEAHGAIIAAAFRAEPRRVRRAGRAP